MKINVKELQDVIKKCTINYTIDSVGFKVTPESVKSNMISPNRSALCFINIPNNLITDLKDEVEFKWNEPAINVKPYISIIKEDEVPIKISDEKVVLNNQIKLTFSHEQSISMYGKDNPINPIDFTITRTIDEEFLQLFSNIKKIGNQFGKVYFTVKDNVLFMESTDKLNKYCNSVKYKLMDIEHPDIQLCLEFKNLVSVISLIEHDDFSLNLSYNSSVKLGCILIKNESESERYYIMSKLEE
jgi:hypothetical protein